MNEEEAIQNIHKKIEREKALMNAANAMRAQTNNEAVLSRLDSQIRDGRRNLQFFEEKLRDVQMRSVNQGVDSMNLGARAYADESGPPPLPPKDAGSWGDRSNYGAMQHGQAGQHADLMPPRHPYAPSTPSPGMPKARPNFTKLGTSTLFCFTAPPSSSAAGTNGHQLTPRVRPDQIRHSILGA